jgi:hypothetical protein
VVSNFFANSGVRAPQPCGLTQERTRTFTFGDVTVRTGLCDHNSRLVDFTTAFDVQVGDFTLFHSGDCSGPEKFALARQPDLWIFHPFCCMDCVAAARRVVRPKKAVIAHLQELGHAKGVWRWTYRDGLDEKKRFAGAGFRSQMPLWGERIV